MLGFINNYHTKKIWVPYCLLHILFTIPFLAVFAFSPSCYLCYHSSSFPFYYFVSKQFFTLHPCFPEYFKRQSLSLSVLFYLSKSHSLFKLLHNPLSFNSPPTFSIFSRIFRLKTGVIPILLLHCLLFFLPSP